MSRYPPGLTLLLIFARAFSGNGRCSRTSTHATISNSPCGNSYVCRSPCIFLSIRSLCFSCSASISMPATLFSNGKYTSEVDPQPASRTNTGFGNAGSRSNTCTASVITAGSAIYPQPVRSQNRRKPRQDSDGIIQVFEHVQQRNHVKLPIPVRRRVVFDHAV